MTHQFSIYSGGCMDEELRKKLINYVTTVLDKIIKIHSISLSRNLMSSQENDDFDQNNYTDIVALILTNLVTENRNPNLFTDPLEEASLIHLIETLIQVYFFGRMGLFTFNRSEGVSTKKFSEAEAQLKTLDTARHNLFRGL
jgi:hypothetical protein